MQCFSMGSLHQPRELQWKAFTAVDPLPFYDNGNFLWEESWRWLFLEVTRKNICFTGDVLELPTGVCFPLQMLCTFWKLAMVASLGRKPGTSLEVPWKSLGGCSVFTMDGLEVACWSLWLTWMNVLSILLIFSQSFVGIFCNIFHQFCLKFRQLSQTPV